MYRYLLFIGVSMALAIYTKVGNLYIGLALLVLAMTIVLLTMRLDKTYMVYSVVAGIILACFSLMLFHGQVNGVDFDKASEYSGTVVGKDEAKDKITIAIENRHFSVSKKKVVLYRAFETYSDLLTLEGGVEVGDRIEMICVLTPFDEPTNPGEGNFRHVYFGQGIIGKIDVLGKLTVVGVGRKMDMAHFQDTVSKRLKHNLGRGLSQKHVGLALGMAIGDKSQLSLEQTDGLRNLGLSHILVVSSLHVGLLLTMAHNGLQRLKLSKWMVEGITLLLLILLYLVSLSKISLVKCFFIYFAHLMGAHYNRKPFFALSLCVYAIIALLYNPYLLYNLSFSLSLMAYCGVFVIYRYSSNRYPKQVQSWYITICIYMAITPILLMSFREFNYLGLFITPLIMPFVEFVITMNFIQCFIQYFVSVPLLAEGMAKLFKIVDYLVAISENIGEQVLMFPYMTAIGTGVFYLLVALLLVDKNRHWITRSRSAMGLLLVLLFCITIGSHHIPLRVFYLDVGMGDGALLYKGNKSVLIDGGTPYKKRILENAMKHLGERVIDIAVISHEHQDHYGGVLELMEEEKIEDVYLTTVAYEKLKSKHPILDTYKGEGHLKFVTEDCTLGILPNWKVSLYAPDEGDKNPNNHSIILLVQQGEQDFLFTGDAEMAEEATILMSALEDVMLPVEFLKVPHHGSRTASSESFLLAARPNYGIISVGSNNRYGLPDEEVVARYERMGTALYFTDADGALEIRVWNPWKQFKEY